MNYTTAVFLINKNVRAVKATYEETPGAKQTLFKTFDNSVVVGDFCIVPTDTRHKLTVVKVTEVDVDFDLADSTPVSWIVGRVDLSAHETTLAQEADAVAAIRKAELRKKREELRDAILADHVDDIKALPIAALNGDTPKAEPTA